MSRKIIGVTVGTPISTAKIGQDLKPEIKEYIDEQLGDVETALDSVLAIQESLINGDSNVVYGYVDENNVVVLRGTLADGSYNIKYDMEDGSLIDVGSLALGDDVEIKNWIPNSVNSDGTPFNEGKGYKTDTRLSISSGGESTSNASGLEVTGYIPVKYNDTVYLKDIVVPESSTLQTVLFFDESFGLLMGAYTSNLFGSTNGEVVSATLNVETVGDDNLTTALAYIRICAEEIGESSIITVNQPIS